MSCSILGSRSRGSRIRGTFGIGGLEAIFHGENILRKRRISDKESKRHFIVFNLVYF